MLHLRVIAPADQAQVVIDALNDDPGVAHLVVLPAAARRPLGDLILCDVVRERADAVFEMLRALGIDQTGAISVDSVEVSLSSSARQAEKAIPGLGSDAVVWDEIEHRVSEETHLSVTYLIFLTVATIIAGIGVLLDQPILIIGAMVVGPEFGPLTALCVGLIQRRRAMATRAIVALVVGFPAAMAVTVVTTWALTGLNLVSKAMLLAERPLTDFIWRPDALSWVIAFLAGVAGMLSLTSAKSGALVGVLISVTTVPAAANVAVAIAYGAGDEAVGSALQLVINIAAIITAGVATLFVQRAWQQYRSRKTREQTAAV